MLSYNFKECFAKAVESGEKCQTVRKSKRASVGDSLQLYTGQRTKNCRLLGRAKTTGTAEIKIHSTGISVRIFNVEGNVPNSDNVDKFIKADGFENYQDFIEFFKNQYGLPFHGFITTWKLD